MAFAMAVALLPAVPTAYAADDDAVIYGKVYLFDTSGTPRPLSNATVMLRDGADLSVNTASDGTYKLEIPAANKSGDNRYTVSIASPNQYHRILEGTTAYGEDTRVVSASKDIANDFYFIDTARVIQIMGTLYTEGDRTPVAGARIISGYTVVTTGSDGSFDHTGTFIREITVEAEGRALYTTEVPLVAYLNGLYYIGSMEMPASKAVSNMTGNAYLFNNGVPTALSGVTVAIAGVPNASATTGADGSFNIDIPLSHRREDNRYTININNPNVSHAILSADASQWGSVSRTVNAEAPVEVYYVNNNQTSIRYYGYVLEYQLDDDSSRAETAISGAQLRVSGFNWNNNNVRTDARGYFEVTARPDNEVFAVVSATGYQGREYRADIDYIEMLKNGSANIGTIYLLGVDGRGPLADAAKNRMTLQPDAVRTSELSFGSLYFSSRTALGNASVIVRVSNFGTVEGDVASLKLFKNGTQVSLNSSDVTIETINMETAELRVAMASVEANAEYKLEFGVRSPAFNRLQRSYNISARILDRRVNNDYMIAVATVFVNDILVEMMSPNHPQGSTPLAWRANILANSENFHVEFTVFAATNPNVVLHRWMLPEWWSTMAWGDGRGWYDGSTHGFGDYTTGISNLPAGNMVLRGRLLYFGREVASDQKPFVVTARPVEVREITIVTRQTVGYYFNTTRTLTIPKGQTTGDMRVIWDNNRPSDVELVPNVNLVTGVQIGLWYGDVHGKNTSEYGTRYPVSASVTFDNLPSNSSAELVFKAPGNITTAKTATRSGNTFSAEFSGVANDRIISGGTGGPYDIEMVVKTPGQSDLTFKIGGITYYNDPSGYVYDAATNERIAGAEVTLWWKSPRNGEWEVFPASSFGQVNPIITAQDGTYAFFVPEGEYRVEVEAEGYITTDNIQARYGPIKVLPIHTEVNIGMVPAQ